MAVAAPSLFGFIPPRTATLLLALLGILVHVNLYTWLGTLRQTLPDVPERPYSLASRLQDSPYGSAARLDQLAGFNAQLDVGIHSAQAAPSALRTIPPVDLATSAKSSVPAWMAEAKAYLKAQGLSFAPESGIGGSDPASQGRADPFLPPSSDPAPSLLSAPAQGSRDSMLSLGPLLSHGGEAYNHVSFDDGAEDAERLNWHAMRLVLSSLRAYTLLCIVCCMAGVVGVLRPNLLLSRLFVIHYFLDLLLTTLSLGSIALLATYPSIRSQICDEYGNGPAVSLFGIGSGGGGSSGSPVAGVVSSSSSTPSSSSLLGVPRTAQGGEVDAAPSSWETLLDGIFTSENCEEAFTSTLIPLFLVAAFVYTATKLHAFICVQRFYSSLLRTRMVQYGYVADPMREDFSLEAPPPVRERRLKQDKLQD
ncbi:uncharacterized protein PFL1_06118 [Pseudozyma flocculosa PF-1]|uniref:Uncharacterized protein n=2 Tax=Pseudozyma flocculosa TaxID=84751 RepID=A0A5C3F333_9BASI|nr:uncharacterized protein PFL1_06118 [Pseudozyma flocculosa PF-1]EPQ26470.1 hypothetical protein PFL1_06118 [Pseudozyma flocculosa PF-1]SPO38933.1 uncharacterized protein PSFLO_04412 [Pseudozyma flocculosa]